MKLSFSFVVPVMNIILGISAWSFALGAEKPVVNYDSENPYLMVNAPVVEILKAEQQANSYSYYLQGEKMKLKEIIKTCIKSRKINPEFSKEVVVLYEKPLGQAQSKYVHNEFGKAGINLKLFQYNNLKQALHQYIKRRKQLPLPVRKSKPENGKVPEIEADFNKISHLILSVSLKKDLNKLSSKEIEPIIEHCNIFLKKYKGEKSHQFYKITQKRLDLFTEIKSQEKETSIKEDSKQLDEETSPR